MSAHYKQPLDWNDKLLEDCKNTIEKWYDLYLPVKNLSKISDEDCSNSLTVNDIKLGTIKFKFSA